MLFGVKHRKYLRYRAVFSPLRKSFDTLGELRKPAAVPVLVIDYPSLAVLDGHSVPVQLPDEEPFVPAHAAYRYAVSRFQSEAFGSQAPEDYLMGVHGQIRSELFGLGDKLTVPAAHLKADISVRAAV